MATSPLKCTKPVNEIKREDIEKSLNFAGVIDFQNTMKEDTPQVIEVLREGDIVSAMITVSFSLPFAIVICYLSFFSSTLPTSSCYHRVTMFSQASTLQRKLA